MLRAFARFQPAVPFLLRVVLGTIFIAHGFQKISSGMPEFTRTVAHLGFPMPVAFAWSAALSEFLGGICCLVGLFTRWAAFLASGLMAFAYWMGHGTRALLPVVNQGELAVLYCFTFLFISARGPGIWSLDAGRRV